MAASSHPHAVDLVSPNGRKYTQPTGLFINNEFVAAHSGQTITSIDPATEQEIATVQAAGEQDVDIAVQAASKALKDPSWKLLPGTERGQLMTKLADLLEQNRELLATIDAWDNGKSYNEALNTDLTEAILTIRYYAGWADKIHGQTISTTHQKLAYTLRQPIGVVAQIIPWNYPLSMATWKLGPALACGNTVVLKAAEQTPLSILVLGQLIREAGFPPGVVNFLNGYGAEAGSALVQHPLVDKVAFTGSTSTARQIMKMASATLKNITLETGGKSPLLVFEDADLEQAIKWSHMGIMSNQGQICTATSRILVQESIYEEFVKRFVEQVKQVSKVGDQWDESTYQGPQVSKVQYERILEYIKSGIEEGATVAIGGTSLQQENGGNGGGGKGFFIAPTVFTNVRDDMKICKFSLPALPILLLPTIQTKQKEKRKLSAKKNPPLPDREEIFGPIVTLSPFKDETSALERANDSCYGLGASIFTSNLERAHRVAAEIEAGMVWINSSQDCDPRVPFGGVKQSGIGRELGEAGLEGYCQIKAVHVNLGSRL